MNPVRKLKSVVNQAIKVYWPYLWQRRLSRSRLGKVTDYKNPRDLNEKIQLLMFYSDT